MGLRRDMLLRQNRDAPARAADVKVHEHARESPSVDVRNRRKRVVRCAFNSVAWTSTWQRQ
jgi:hypothetical protein